MISLVQKKLALGTAITSGGSLNCRRNLGEIRGERGNGHDRHFSAAVAVFVETACRLSVIEGGEGMPPPPRTRLGVAGSGSCISAITLAWLCSEAHQNGVRSKLSSQSSPTPP